MAVSQEQKVDFLLKKLGFTKTKTGLAVDSTLTGTKKAGFAEAIPSPLIIANSSVWNEADSIPATPPGSDTNQVRVYLAATSGHRMTVDTTVADNRAFIAFSTYNDTSSTRLNNWIDTQFGAGYLIKVFKGDPNSGGVQLSAAGSGQNDGWFFDYSAGVLNFNDTNVPSGVTGTNIYVVGYRYIGQTGAPTSGISTFSFLDLSVERNLDVGVQGGISTFRNNIDLNADLDVDGHTNLDNVNITGISTIFDLDVDGHTNLDNVSVAGVTTFSDTVKVGTGVTALTNGNVSIGGTLELFNTTGNASNNPSEIKISNLTISQHNNTGTYKLRNSGFGGEILLSAGGGGFGGLSFWNSNFSRLYFQARDQGFVSLYYNNTVRFKTSGVGATVYGNLDVTADLDVDGHTNLDNVSVAGVTTFADDVTFTTANGNNIVFDKSDNSLQFGDNVGAKFGSGNDLTLFHSGSVGVLRNSQGNFKIEPTPGEKGLVVLPNAGVELFYDNVQKFVTTSSGISVAGSIVATGNVTAVDGTFSGNVSIGGTLTYEDVKNVDSVGLITARSGIRVTGGIIEAQAGENKIPFLYANTSSLPDPSTYHGMFAHVHATQKGYFAHAGNWYELVNRELTGTVGTGTETYNIKHLNSVGISTFTSTIDANGDLDVDGHTNLDNVSIAGVTTFSGNIGGTANFNNIDVDGHTELDNVKITGFTTFHTGTRFYHHTPRIEMQGNSTATLSFVNNTTGTTTSDGMLMGFSSSSTSGFINVLESGHGFILKTGGSAIGNERINISGVGTVSLRYGTSEEMVTARPNGAVELYHNGIKRLETSSVGVSIPQDLDVDGHTELDNVNVSGIITSAAARVNGATVLNGNVEFYGSNYGIAWYKNQGRLGFLDNATLSFGNGVDTQIKHDNSNLLISNTTGNIDVTGNVVLNNDLDVDGHTNLDNVSISGVSTFTGDATFNGNITFGDATIDNVVFTGDVNSNIIPNTDNTYTLGTSSKRWAAIHVGLSTVGEDITTRNLDVSGIGTIGSGGSGQAILQYQGSTKLTTLSWGVHATGTFQAIGNLEALNSSSQTDGKDIHIKNAKSGGGVKNVLTLSHTNNNSSITGHVGNISINAPTVSISTNFTVAGVTTLSGNTVQGGQLQLNSTLKAGGTVGSNGYYLKSTGIGVTWSAFPTARTTQSFTASSGQTTFNFAYNVNYLDVFVNGTKLTPSEFTATNGTSVVLAVGCFVGDIVDLISYNVIASGGATGIDNIVEDVTPQLGGNLDLFNKTITGTGNINMTGVATATKFVGDGSGLTGIVASGSGVVVKDNGSAVGTAGTINFGTNLDVSDISAGIVTVTAAGITTANIISDTITSETLNVTGISTFSSLVKLPDSTNNQTGRLMLGTGTDLQIFHTGSAGEIGNFTGILNIKSNSFRVFNGAGTQAYITADQNSSVSIAFSGTNKLATTASGIDVTGTAVNDGMVCAGVGTFSGLINANANIKRATGNLDINASNIVLKNAADSATYASFNNGGNVELHFNNVKRFETTNTGAVVAGIMTATSFSGDGSNLTGISGVGTDNVRTNTLEVVGVSTFSGNVELGPTSGIGITFNGSHGNGQFTGFVTSYSGVEIQKTGGDFRFKDEAGNQLGAMQGESSNFGFFGHGNGNGRIDFYTGNDYRMRIQPGGDINVGTAATINGVTGNATYTGIVTATTFSGSGASLTNLPSAQLTGALPSLDGSALTGITASGTGVIVQHDGSNIGTAGTINFSTNLDVSAISAGIVTVTASGGGGTDVGITTNLSGTFTASAGTPSTINTFTGYSSDDLVVEYTIYIKNGSDFQTQKLLAMRDGTTIHSTQFAVMFSSSLLVQCDATISSGNILLRATPETGVSGSTTYKVKREVM